MRKEKGKRKKEKVGDWRRRARTFAFLLFTFSFLSCGPERNSPVAANAKFAYCPVCQMRVSADDQWTGEIFYSDGTKLMFESPGDLLAYYVEPEKYQVKRKQKADVQIARIVVRDYTSHAPIDARQAALVYKSRVEGPMGADFLPFESREEAEAFVKVNGGLIVQLRDVTQGMVQNLRAS